MDRNTELLLAKAQEAARWEDQEKASNDLNILRAEFRRRLYVREEGASPTEHRNGAEPSASE